jgi:hypothetical protein
VTRQVVETVGSSQEFKLAVNWPEPFPITTGLSEQEVENSLLTAAVDKSGDDHPPVDLDDQNAARQYQLSSLPLAARPLKLSIKVLDTDYTN